MAADGEPLGIDLLPEPSCRASAPEPEVGGTGTTLREEVRRLEARLIGQTLRENNWNKLRTARALKFSYPALLKKIREYNLDRRRVAAPTRPNTQRCLHSDVISFAMD